MKQINKAFSLIELVVVVSIIAVVWISSVSNFWLFSDSQNMQNQVSDFSSHLQELDKDIEQKNIFDYSLNLKKWNLYFVVSKNEEFSYYKANIDIDNNSLTWVLSISWITSTWTNWDFDLSYSDFQNDTMTLDALDKYTYNFANNSSFIIDSYISWKMINSLKILYFSEKNMDLSEKSSNKVYLSDINTKANKTWSSLSSIFIQNINNKKFIKNKSEQIIDKVYLFFGTWWKEISLEIK